MTKDELSQGQHVVVLDSQYLRYAEVDRINEKSVVLAVEEKPDAFLLSVTKRVKVEDISRKICKLDDRIHVLVTLPQERYDIVHDASAKLAKDQFYNVDYRYTGE